MYGGPSIPSTECSSRMNLPVPSCSFTPEAQSIRLFLIPVWLRFQSLFKWAPTKTEVQRLIPPLPPPPLPPPPEAPHLPPLHKPAHLSLSHVDRSQNIGAGAQLSSPTKSTEGGGEENTPHGVLTKDGEAQVRAPGAKLREANVWQSNYTLERTGSD